ncbi:MAG: CBS domain-containing protein [Firmicutes bacterium]|nr:CBS domain-containing protein [Bacillota bacterium]
MIVKDLMTVSVTCVRPDMPADAVIRIMQCEDVGIVPVCDIQNHLLGVITDRDIIMRDGFGKTAGEIMTTPVFTADIKEDIHDAALRMSEQGVRRLPVLENEKLAGMLSLKDLSRKRIFTAEIGHIIYNICNKKI